MRWRGPVDLLHGSFLARSAIERYLRRHPVGSMRGSADRRLRDSRGNGWQLFLLAAERERLLAAAITLALVAPASMPALLGWHRARSSPFHATGGCHTPTSMSASLAIANIPALSSFVMAARLRTSSALVRWNVNLSVPPRG